MIESPGSELGPQRVPGRWPHGNVVSWLSLVATLCVAAPPAAAQAGGDAPDAEPDSASIVVVIDVPQRSFLRPTWQIGAVHVVGLAVYIYKGELNHYDWPLTGQAVKERFTSLNPYRFDENEFGMNNIAHPVAGMLYYRFARANGFGPGGSFLWSAAASTFWEVIIEIREIASINDMILTPASGLALGEALHQHELFFRRALPTRGNRALDVFFGAPVFLDRVFGGETPPRAERVSDLGLPVDRAHRFRLRADHGTAAVSEDGALPGIRLGASSEISSVPPAYAERPRDTGAKPLTRLDFDVALAGDQLGRVDFGAETVLGGWSQRALRVGSDGAPRGGALLIAPFSAFYIHVEEHGEPLWDLLATSDLIGVRADGVLYGRDVQARLTGSVAPSFSSIRPAALFATWPDEPLPLSKSVLQRNQYYYGYGYTALTRAELEFAGVALRAEWKHHRVDSFNGRNRRIEEGPDTLRVRDWRTWASAWLDVGVAPGLRVGAGLETRQAGGALRGATVRRGVTGGRVGVRIGTD